MTKRKSVPVVEPTEEIPTEVLAGEIVEISRAMKRISSGRLSRQAIVVLIHDKSKVNKGVIELVLNNLERLEEIWLKKVSR